MENIKKPLLIADIILASATNMINILKQLPKGKTKKNIFIKTYNRRPMNKRKTAMLIAAAGMDVFIGAVEIQKIISMPIPKPGIKKITTLEKPITNERICAG